MDAEWMVYLGAFRHLRCLNLADCRGVNNSALWAVTGMMFDPQDAFFFSSFVMDI